MNNKETELCHFGSSNTEFQTQEDTQPTAPSVLIEKTDRLNDRN